MCEFEVNMYKIIFPLAFLYHYYHFSMIIASCDVHMPFILKTPNYQFIYNPEHLMFDTKLLSNKYVF